MIHCFTSTLRSMANVGIQHLMWRCQAQPAPSLLPEFGIMQVLDLAGGFLCLLAGIAEQLALNKLAQPIVDIRGLCRSCAQIMLIVHNRQQCMACLMKHCNIACWLPSYTSNCPVPSAPGPKASFVLTQL